jgi:hypothetical protein
MLQRNEHGFSVIGALLILVIMGIVGFAGWFVYHGRQAADTALNATNKVSQSNAKSPPKTRATDNTQKYLVITEWGVKLSLEDPILDQAVYTKPVADISGAQGVESILLATHDTLSFDYTCGGQEGDGGEPISHTTSSDQDHLLRAHTADELQNASNNLPSQYTHIGNYYYVYQHNTGHGDCVPTDQSVGAKAQQVGNAFAKSTILAE